MKAVREALLDEFACYYHADLLPSGLPDSIDTWADDSGRRLVHILGEGAREAVAMLHAVARRQDEQLLIDLDNETHYGWSGSHENWQLFLRIVEHVAASVERGLAGQDET